MAEDSFLFSRAIFVILCVCAPSVEGGVKGGCVTNKMVGSTVLQFGANLCDEATCGLIGFSLILQAFRLFFGVLEPKSTISPLRPSKWPFAHSKTQCFNGKLPNFVAPKLLHNQRYKNKDSSKWTDGSSSLWRLFA